jgi:ATP-binding cassette subfamily B protein
VVFTLLPEFFYMLVSTKRMRDLRREPVMAGEEQFVPANYNIELKNVGFSYHEGDEVIKNISLSIPQGGLTALAGPSGSGKSTLSRLIARFWDVREGANDDEVYAAAKTARGDGFIRELPDGYDTVIGENGSTLSGGERQRISIARALLKNAPIVLLDEATASLDPENEALIQEAVSALVKNRTVIVIAHRLRTVIGADKIAVLEKGRLAEEGSGEELLARDGLFARLYRIQQESLGWTAGRMP